MKTKWIFTYVTFVIGFMLAIQFNATQEPVIRDTRDVRELRSQFLSAQEKRQQLSTEVGNMKELIDKYKQTVNHWEDDITNVLEEQIYELQKEAGLVEKSGKGLVITIAPLMNGDFAIDHKRTPPPHVFRYLINELNIYGATDIAVENERIISTSAFRSVNDITHLNSRRIPPLPIEMKVLTEEPENLYNQMVVSESVDFFEINGFLISFEVAANLTLPAYNQPPRVRYMKEVKEG